PGGMNVTIEPIAEGRTRMTIENVFPDTATMEQLLAMGQEEGMTEAVGQIDAILAEDPVAGAARCPAHESRTELTMTTTTATEPITKTLDVPGATLTYDVRRSETPTEPPLFLIGSPTGAG